MTLIAGKKDYHEYDEALEQVPREAV